MSQTRVKRLATALLAVLNQVLARRELLPVRDGAVLTQCLAHYPAPVFTFDRVERGVPHNLDREAQAEEHSAKKSRPLEKNDFMR